MVSPADLFKAFRGATVAADIAPYARAEVGLLNTNGTRTIETEDNPDLWYVTIEGTVVDRVEPRGCGRIPGLPVFIEIDPMTNRRYISRPDPIRARQYVGQGVPLGQVGPHTHDRPDLGYFDFVSGIRMKPGLVTLNGDMTVRIWDHFMQFNGTRTYIPTQDLDLTPFKPSTTNKWAWVLVVDDVVNLTPTAVTGAEVSVLSPLTPQELAAISAGDNYPLMGIKVRADQTALSDWRLVMDARNWVGSGGGTGAADALNSVLTDKYGIILTDKYGRIITAS
jgi:hypothetical protein